ncbi:uncharacterized protein LOC125666367 [Ostrea edulis]|uniref:uncharacterized protein LOC125666367 n=1 Tax=Ostrea edulis TaxID=37623 RepID=UPI0024AF67B3|nr:uncharacterized protein LOC125666367 [Ostrea edulis]
MRILRTTPRTHLQQPLGNLQHKVVQIHQRRSTPVYPKCSLHESRACEIQCSDHPLCSQCVSSEQHRGHIFNNLLEIFNSKKQEILNDFEELIKTISPAYDASTMEIENEINSIAVEYEKLSTSVTKHGNEWHNEVDRVVSKLKKEVKEMKRKHLELLKELLTITKNLQSLAQQGSLLKTISTESGSPPNDITVPCDGDLIYSDWKTKTVNKVKNGQTEEVIRLQGWTPNNFCVTFSGNNSIKYICENRNLNICVADCGAQAVVVVNLNGKLRFKYTGHLSTTEARPFNPSGIATDSQSHILTSDSNNHCIHILDRNAQFLCYIDNCNLNQPWGLCVDNNDNVIVAECSSGKVKAIRYLF